MGRAPLCSVREPARLFGGGSVEELFPIIAGLVSGLLIGWLGARRRLAVGVLVSIVGGVLATVLSGEWRVSWAFLLFDIPLVAACATAGYFLSRAVTLRKSAAQSTPR